MADSIQRLHAAVLAARHADPALSRTARLAGEGVSKMAKKLAEEAFEVGLEAVQGERHRTIQESADLLYHLLVVLRSRDVALQDVLSQLESRTARSGLAEKAARSD